MNNNAQSRFAEFESIEVGDEASESRVIRAEDVDAFSTLSGDVNPLHVDDEFAEKTTFRRRVAHGMLLGGYLSALVGTRLPGAGALWTQQSLRWPAPVHVGDTIDIRVTVTHKSAGTRTLKIGVKAVNQNGKTVMDGEGSVVVLESKEHGRGIPLSERLAFVTGGSRGIGASIARALAEAGARVALTYLRREDLAAALCRQIVEEGGNAMAIHADVTDFDSIRDAIQKAADAFGRPVSALVNNAARAAIAGPLVEAEWEEIQSHIDTHVRGAFNATKAALPGMIGARSGCIVNIGSILTWGAPPPNLGGHVLAKAALRAMTRSLAVELGPQGIRVNMVSPGMTGTDSIADVPERLRKVQAMQTPLRRLATSSDIGGTVAFLCSESGEFINGADIPVCGGISM